MRRMVILVITFFLAIQLCFSQEKYTSAKNYYCDESCGVTSSYKLITVDAFESIYSSDKYSIDKTKVCLKNLTIFSFREDTIDLVDSDVNVITCFCDDEKIKEAMVLNKKHKANIYGHIFNHKIYGYCVAIDIVEIK